MELAVVLSLIYLAALGGLAYWIKQWIVGLQGAVEAQKDTISAQVETLSSLRNLLDSMSRVIESTDEPKMLARVKAYKELLTEKKRWRLRRLRNKKINK